MADEAPEVAAVIEQGTVYRDGDDNDEENDEEEEEEEEEEEDKYGEIVRCWQILPFYLQLQLISLGSTYTMFRLLLFDSYLRLIIVIIILIVVYISVLS